MQTPFADLMEFANISVFSQLADAQASFILPSGVVVDTPAIFDEAYHRVDIGSYGASSIQPALSIQLNSLAPITDPAACRLPVTVVRTTGTVTQTWDYVVAEFHPDGTGVALLLLELSPKKVVP